ncbi:MAG: hypothetical protein AB7F66_05785 [Bacteriovoracia bacterium]
MKADRKKILRKSPPQIGTLGVVIAGLLHSGGVIGAPTPASVPSLKPTYRSSLELIESVQTGAKPVAHKSGFALASLSAAERVSAPAQKVAQTSYRPSSLAATTPPPKEMLDRELGEQHDLVPNTLQVKAEGPFAWLSGNTPLMQSGTFEVTPTFSMWKGWPSNSYIGQMLTALNQGHYYSDTQDLVGNFYYMNDSEGLPAETSGAPRASSAY